MGRQIRLLFGSSIFWLALAVLFDGINTLVLPLQLSEFASQKNQAIWLGLFTLIGPFAGLNSAPLIRSSENR